MHNAIIYIVDDDVSMRRALARLLRSLRFIVRSFESAEMFLDHGRDDTPSCLVTDLKMPGLSGLELQEELIAREILIPIIFITGYGDIPTSVRAMKNGAVNFLTKPLHDATLVRAINDAIEKDLIQLKELDAISNVRDCLASLTPREHEVMELVIRGMRNKQIAHELGISDKTVKIHRSKIMLKMNVRSVAELVSIVHKHSANSNLS